MKKIVYRVIFNKLAAGNKRPFADYLIRQFGYSEKTAGLILNSTPAILYESTSRNQTRSVLENARALNARVNVQKLIKDDRLPFPIGQWQLKWISKLLNMTLRAGRDSALLYVHVHPLENKNKICSFLGQENRLEDFFRESDSVYILNNTKILLFGFTTDDAGIRILIPKVIKIVRDIMGHDAKIKIGEAIFPDDGYSFYELVSVIEKKMRFYNAADEKKHDTPVPDNDRQEELVTEPAVQTIDDFYQTLFSNARGKLFQVLASTDLEILWAGLKKIPLTDQKQFFLRLPFNSRLANVLAGKIKAQTSVKEPEIIKIFDRRFSSIDIEKKGIERKKRRSEIIAKLNRLESFSTIQAVALQVYNVAMNPDSDIDDIQQIIQLDQVMTLKLLKLVNSSFYGLSQKVTSVKEAAIILGMDEIMNMAFGLSLSESFKSSNLKDLLDPEALWKHSVETALIGKHLCQGKIEFDKQGIFAACILHDFGKLFLIDHFPDDYRKVIKISKETHIPLYDIEEEYFGCNHGVIGGILSKKWNLPESLTQAISYHHHPSLSSGYSGLAAITGFANFLCHKNNTEDKEMLPPPQLLKDHMETLNTLFDNFTLNSIENSLKDVRNLLKEKADIFSIIS